MALFLGLDCSTQSMTAVVTRSEDPLQDTASLSILASVTFQFDVRLPHYGTTNGVLFNNGHVEVPSLMLVEALERILDDVKDELAKTGHTMSQIRAVSGCAQQHTSVFWRLAELNLPRDGSLHAFLKEQRAFDPEHGRSWMDSTTTSQCLALESAVGGSRRMAVLTGSRAYERFTGIQLMAMGDMEGVARVSLASSLLTSLFGGKICAVEHSDASGMNVMDLHTRKWSTDVIEAIEAIGGFRSGTFRRYLGPDPIPPTQSVGSVADFFQQAHAFSADCAVIPFTGDNPSCLAGMGLSQRGDIGISLGTSGCIFAVGTSADIVPSGEFGHVMVNAVDPTTLMAMLCFKNGSLARENLRDRRAGGTWEGFSQLMDKSPCGNNGFMGFFYLQPEITPVVPAEAQDQRFSGVHGFDGDDKSSDVRAWPPEVEVRAIVEWQCLAMYRHIQKLYRGPVRRVVVGGGASVNTCILNTIAHVFNAPVFVEATGVNTAALGGALRAQHGLDCFRQNTPVPFRPRVQWELKASPSDSLHRVYVTMLERFERLESIAIASQKEKYSV